MIDDNEKETGFATETDGNAGVSDRSEREIESGDTGLEADADGSDERAADDTGDDPKRTIDGIKKRLGKLTAQRNQSRAEAQKTAAERDVLRERLAAYEKREREEKAAREAKVRATPEWRDRELKRRAVRETLDEAFYPGYSEQQERIAQRQEQAEQRAKEEFAQRGISYLASELQDHGIPVDAKTLIRFERAVGSELQEDPELLARFQSAATQKDAIAEAFNRHRDGVINPVLKTKGASALARVERNREAVLGGGRTPGASPGVEEPERELTPPKGLKGRPLEQWWKDVAEKEWKRLSALEG